MPSKNPKPKPKRPRPKKYARYSDNLRAEALAALKANRGNVEKTARQMNVRPTTLRNWMTQKSHPEATENGEEKRGPLADRLESLAWKLVEGIDNPAKIKKAPINQLSVSAGILIDKFRLLRGEPTDISEFKDDDRLREFEERYAEANAPRPVVQDDDGESPDPTHAVPGADAVPST